MTHVKRKHRKLKIEWHESTKENRRWIHVLWTEKQCDYILVRYQHEDTLKTLQSGWTRQHQWKIITYKSILMLTASSSNNLHHVTSKSKYMKGIKSHQGEVSQTAWTGQPNTSYVYLWPRDIILTFNNLHYVGADITYRPHHCQSPDYWADDTIER